MHEHAGWRLVDGALHPSDAALLVEGTAVIAELRELLTDSLVALVAVAQAAGALELARAGVQGWSSLAR